MIGGFVWPHDTDTCLHKGRVGEHFASKKVYRVGGT
jgi:hypothetical protein